jgi:hypothetical protein
LTDRNSHHRATGAECDLKISVPTRFFEASDRHLAADRAGIRRDGQKIVLDQNEAAWRAVLDDLLARGLATTMCN